MAMSTLILISVGYQSNCKMTTSCRNKSAIKLLNSEKEQECKRLQKISAVEASQQKLPVPTAQRKTFDASQISTQNIINCTI